MLKITNTKCFFVNFHPCEIYLVSAKYVVIVESLFACPRVLNDTTQTSMPVADPRFPGRGGQPLI